MNRIFGLNASTIPPALPASVEQGYVKDSGDSTVPGYWWYHMITETLMAVIVGAGLTPSNTDMTQLQQAVTILAKQNAATAAFQPVRAVDTVGVTMNGLQTVDGQSLVAGDRCLRAVGSDPSNGIWVVNSAGGWTRPSDWAIGTILPEGVLVEVADGAVNGNTVWTLDLSTSGTATVGTTAVSFVDITASTKAMFASYLTIANAASTYLTQTAAASTYATIASTANFITSATAASTYLTQTNAANTYCTISSFNTLNTNVSNNYLTKASASSTYETISDMTTKYTYLTGTPRLTGLSVNCVGGGTAGWIYAAGDVVSGYSDDRLKERRSSVQNVTEKLKALDVFYYEPNENALSRGATPGMDLGLSAQQLEQAFTELVTDSPLNTKNDIEDRFKTIRYERLTAVLLRGWQEQQQQIELLQSQVDALRSAQQP